MSGDIPVKTTIWVLFGPSGDDQYIPEAKGVFSTEQQAMAVAEERNKHIEQHGPGACDFTVHDYYLNEPWY